MFKEIDLAAPNAKGNVDVDLTLHAMMRLPDYRRALLITSDGDFASLVTYLKQQNRLEAVLSPSKRHCSRLLKKAATGHLRHLEDVRDKVDKK